MPFSLILNTSAAADERSIILSLAYGPRSFTFNVIPIPFSKFVTRTSDGIGSVLCAAVNFVSSKISPFAVLPPENDGPYHDAIPISL